MACVVAWLAGGFLIRLTTGTDNPDVLYYGQMNLRIVMPFMSVLGVLFIQRTCMQAMGQKLIPVISSCIEVLMRLAGAVWMIPVFGYPGVCWNTSLTWSVMTVFIVIMYYLHTQKLLRPEGQINNHVETARRAA